MKSEIVTVTVAFMSIVGVPWTVFVTLNIFALKQQVALLKQELSVLQEIRQLLQRIGAK